MKTREQRRIYGRRYYRKNRMRLSEYRRSIYAGTHLDWLKRAFIKAGGSPLDWPRFREAA